MLPFLNSNPLTIDPVTYVWIACVAVVIAILVIFFNKNINGLIIRKLLSFGTGKENAKTLGELSLNKFMMLIAKILLRDGSTYRSYVYAVEDEEIAPEDEDANEESESSAEDEEDTEKKDEEESTPAKDELPEGEKDFEGAETSPKIEELHFYIPEDKAYKAETTYKEIKWWLLPIFIVGTVALSYLATLIVPWLVEQINL